MKGGLCARLFYARLYTAKSENPLLQILNLTANTPLETVGE